MSYKYPSALDSLALEPLDQQPSHINEEAAAADLALWTNAKFTYDTAPGQGILDDKSAAPFDLDKAMYEHLVQYLDLDLTSAQPQQQQQQQQQSADTTDSLTFDTTLYKSIATSRQQPTLLPKPESNNDNLFLLPTPTQQSAPVVVAPVSSDSILNDNGKRPLASTSASALVEDRAHGDDDKRKRNTAASARFRIKKKQKEQAMAQTVREMTDKTDKLQNRVHELESEIKWLRELLLEKNASK